MAKKKSGGEKKPANPNEYLKMERRLFCHSIMGLRYKKDVAANVCIFIQTKEKSPNANCVQTQSGFTLQKDIEIEK